MACNNIVKQDLSAFSRFTNLRNLLIGNWDSEKIKQKIYNHFVGSLEPLKNFTKLEWLNISNTDIEEGLEYLPVSLNTIDCKADKKSFKVQQIYNFLKPFGKWYLPPSNLLGRLITDYDYYDYQEWRKANINSEKMRITQLEKELEETREHLSNLQVQEANIQIPPK